MTNDSMFPPSEKLAAFLNDPTIEDLMSGIEYDLEQAGFARPNLTQMLKIEAHNYQVSDQQEDISGSLVFVQEALECAAVGVKTLNAAWAKYQLEAVVKEVARAMANRNERWNSAEMMRLEQFAWLIDNVGDNRSPQRLEVLWDWAADMVHFQDVANRTGKPVEYFQSGQTLRVLFPQTIKEAA